VTPIEAARGIVRIANNNMINALKLVSINRGYDPRDFTLVAFGGGGAMHAAALGMELGVKKVVIPRGAPVFSAWGMMMSDLRRDYFVTRLIETDGEPHAVAAAIGWLLDEALERARGQFREEGIAPERLKLTPLLKCRYQNQEHAVEVPMPVGPVTPHTVETLTAHFHHVYEREYTYRLDAPVEVVGLHLVSAAEVGKLELVPLAGSGASIAAARKGRRSVDYATEGVHEADIYAADRLEPGMQLAGPAIIEDAATTTVIHPGQQASIDVYGNTHIAFSR
jgi:N-methylhydantoinase A